MKSSAHKSPEWDPQTLARCRFWMNSRGWSPQPFQEDTWAAICAGSRGIVNAPTGSGKTYSLLLPFLVQFTGKEKTPGLKLIWITPIRALTREIQLSAQRVIDQLSLPLTCGVRTGDTPEAERLQQRKDTPDILITTPESLHLMLARRGCISFFSDVRMFVADEWHELMGTKRGVMVELALSRLRRWVPGVSVWGISATIGNLPDALSMLLGPEAAREAVLIRSGLRKEIEVESIMPDTAERMPWSGHLGIRMLDRVLPVIRRSNSTLVFTNTRAQCEVWYRHLLTREPSLAGVMAMHHGSISKQLRYWVEDAIYQGKLKVVVCTSSLDLGVDFAPVDTIVQIGGPKGVARFLQRAGRSGHRPGELSKIYFLPTHSLELIEAAALRQAIKEEFVEERIPMSLCFDVLIQYLVTLSLGDGFKEEDLYQEVRSTLCFAELTREEWKWVMAFITSGGHSLEAYPEYRRVVEDGGLYKVAGQRIARRHRLSIGTIVGDTMMSVRFVRGGLIGHIEESFIASLQEGDHFWFAGQGLQLVRIKELTAYVTKSSSVSGKIPSWQGGKLPLSSRMSVMLRRKLTEAAGGNPNGDPELERIQPILELQQLRSRVPAEREFLIELFQDDEGYHAVFYPFEGRFVHEGLASLFASRIGRLKPISVSMAYNDYGFELLSELPIPVEEAIANGLFSVQNLERDLLQGINANELSKRRFREIAAISGLVFKGYPGQPVKDRHLQSSASLIFQVFEEFDPENLLMRQAVDEVIHYQLEFTRLQQFLRALSSYQVIITHPLERTPFSFPIIVDRLREKMSTEELDSRIARMTLGVHP